MPSFYHGTTTVLFCFSAMTFVLDLKYLYVPICICMCIFNSWPQPPRSCDVYWSEFKHCKSLFNRFHEYYTYGKSPDCQQWKQDYYTCKEWEKNHSTQAKVSLARWWFWLALMEWLRFFKCSWKKTFLLTKAEYIWWKMQ